MFSWLVQATSVSAVWCFDTRITDYRRLFQKQAPPNEACNAEYFRFNRLRRVFLRRTSDVDAEDDLPNGWQGEESFECVAIIYYIFIVYTKLSISSII